MANIRKSFNFRNGVQVDDDNFIVNANGLVGIGTSIPTEFLDVHGTAKITGLVTATNLAVTGISNFYSDVKVGSGITFNPSTGEARATTFYGSAAGLTDIYAIAVDGWYIDGGNISTTSNVGIGTTLPYYSLQVGQDPLIGNGFSVDAITGNVKTNGIITSPSFVGNLTGNLSGNVNSTGISTFITLQVGTGVTITDGNIISTNFVGNLSGNVNSTGISTFITLQVGTGVTISGGIVTATSFNGPLTGTVTGTATTALSLPSSASILVTSVNSGFTSTGIATITDTLYATKIGVGTVTAPVGDIEVNKTGISSIRVISSNNNIASIGIGRSAEIRTGNSDTVYSYSSRNSLDIINSNSENINYYLDYGSAGLGTGNFNWIYGQNPSSPLMSLTYGGNLGLGITNPSTKLYVVGSSYITGITTINGNVDLNQNLYVFGDITFNGSLNGDLGITTFSRLGIATDTISDNSYEFFVGGDPIFGDGVSITKTDIRASGNIQSTNIISTNINVTDVSIFDGKVGIGITNPTEELHVIGDGYFTGIVTATTFDGSVTNAYYASISGISTISEGLSGTPNLEVGIVTATAFTSGIGVTNPVQITVSGNILTFNVVGVGSTSLTLF